MKSIYQKLISNLNFPIEKLCTSLARVLRPGSEKGNTDLSLALIDTRNTGQAPTFSVWILPLIFVPRARRCHSREAVFILVFSLSSISS